MKASYLLFVRPFSYAFFCVFPACKERIKNYSKEGRRRRRCKSQIYESEDHIKENKLCDMIRMKSRGQGSRSYHGSGDEALKITRKFAS